MQLSKLFNDDKAVSPVIGVILMVAITVILAAVIGTFVLGLGDSVGDTAPSASYDWDQNSAGDEVTLTHVSGQNIDADRVTGTVGGTETEFDGDSLGVAWADPDDRISSGDSIEWSEGDQTIESNGELRVIWTASGGGSSSTLTSYTVE
ncbi:type IV pilin [Halorubrum sp. JWXQ-INN 858]|uniref:type IV pilin n=1 Tax=Halorubrum sp. JWXQ-INN 858 TaxID=2690782 RepID=UPI00135CE4DB|nr:type IV pilin N-terminal domain-containing protein [Halorubrum sp. JWXQ-INN 858]MWV65948.1 type IV pilin [Halorubrum sp. JWXQ-INN 858]